MKCNNCGKEIPSNAVNCPFCHANVDSENMIDYQKANMENDEKSEENETKQNNRNTERVDNIQQKVNDFKQNVNDFTQNALNDGNIKSILNNKKTIAVGSIILIIVSLVIIGFSIKSLKEDEKNYGTNNPSTIKSEINKNDSESNNNEKILTSFQTNVATDIPKDLIANATYACDEYIAILETINPWEGAGDMLGETGNEWENYGKENLQYTVMFLIKNNNNKDMILENPALLYKDGNNSGVINGPLIVPANGVLPLMHVLNNKKINDYDFTSVLKNAKWTPLKTWISNNPSVPAKLIDVKTNVVSYGTYKNMVVEDKNLDTVKFFYETDENLENYKQFSAFIYIVYRNKGESKYHLMQYRMFDTYVKAGEDKFTSTFPNGKDVYVFATAFGY